MTEINIDTSSQNIAEQMTALLSHFCTFTTDTPATCKSIRWNDLKKRVGTSTANVKKNMIYFLNSLHLTDNADIITDAINIFSVEDIKSIANPDDTKLETLTSAISKYESITNSIKTSEKEFTDNEQEIIQYEEALTLETQTIKATKQAMVANVPIDQVSQDPIDLFSWNIFRKVFVDILIHMCLNKHTCHNNGGCILVNAGSTDISSDYDITIHSKKSTQNIIDEFNTIFENIFDAPSGDVFDTNAYGLGVFYSSYKMPGFLCL